MKATNRRSKRLVCIVGSVCGLLLTLLLSSCTDAWQGLILPEGEKLPNVDSDLLYADTTARTDPVTETEAPRYDFDDEQIHSGVGIAYEGHANSPNNRFCIVIDAGHQGTAVTQTEPIGPGASATAEKMTAGYTGKFTGQAEHELNLAVAIQLRNELGRRGYSVVMIREKADPVISEKERAELANEVATRYDRTVYVRIHAGSSENIDERGAMAVYPSAGNPFPTCAAHYEQSRLLSEVILESYCTATDNVRKHETPLCEDDSRTAANWSRIPTTSIVLGFLSNETEDVFMSYSDFREDAAWGIANGIEAYFRRVTGIQNSERPSETIVTTELDTVRETLPVTEPEFGATDPETTAPGTTLRPVLGTPPETDPTPDADPEAESEATVEPDGETESQQ